MLVKLIAQCKTEQTIPPTISLSGLVLTVGDIVIDLSQIPEGGSAEWDDPTVVKGTATRDFIEIVYPYSTHEYEPYQSSNPADYEIELLDGQTLQCPLVRRPTEPDPVVPEEPVSEETAQEPIV